MEDGRLGEWREITESKLENRTAGGSEDPRLRMLGKNREAMVTIRILPGRGSPPTSSGIGTRRSHCLVESVIALVNQSSLKPWA